MVGGSDYSKIAEQLGDGDEGRRSTQSRLHSPDGGGGSSEGPRSLAPSKTQPRFCGAEGIEETV